jgi:hypothetical protein
VTDNVRLAARALVTGFGKGAAFETRCYINKCLVTGDIVSTSIWRAVLIAVEEMLREPPQAPCGTTRDLMPLNRGYH